MAEEPKVEITLREIYDTQVAMRETLNDIKTVVHEVNDHEIRLRKVESRMATWAGGLLVLTPVASVVATHLFGA